MKNRLSKLINRRGQSTLEYALLVAVVCAAFLAMRTYVMRAAQAQLKTIENQLNEGQ